MRIKIKGELSVSTQVKIISFTQTGWGVAQPECPASVLWTWIFDCVPCGFLLGCFWALAKWPSSPRAALCYRLSQYFSTGTWVGLGIWLEYFMVASKVRCPKTYPSRWSPWGRSRTCWIDYSSWLVWECLSVLLNELEETSGQDGWVLGWMMFSEICQWPGKEPGLVPYLKPELPSNIPLFNVWYLLTYWKVELITQKWLILKYTVFWVCISSWEKSVLSKWDLVSWWVRW